MSVTVPDVLKKSYFLQYFPLQVHPPHRFEIIYLKSKFEYATPFLKMLPCPQRRKIKQNKTSRTNKLIQWGHRTKDEYKRKLIMYPYSIKKVIKMNLGKIFHLQ